MGDGARADGMPGTCGSWAWCEKWKQKLNEILWQTRRDQQREWEWECEWEGEWVMQGGSGKKGFDRRCRHVELLCWWADDCGAGVEINFKSASRSNSTKLIVGLSVCQLADRQNLLLLFDVLIWACRVCLAVKRVRERQGSRVREVANRKGKFSIFLRFFLAVSAFPVSAKAYANISPASGKMAKQRNGAHPAWLNKWIFDSSVKSRSIGVRNNNSLERERKWSEKNHRET